MNAITHGTVLFIAISSVLFAGCREGVGIGLLVAEAARSGFDHQKAIQTGRTGVKVIQQVESLLGQGIHLLTGPTQRHHDGVECEWVATVYFGGRYELDVRVPVVVDRSTSTVVRTLDETKFHLTEVTRCEGRGFSFGGLRHEFSEAEWAKVVAANGDFAAIGLALSSEPPVAGFNEFTGQLLSEFQGTAAISPGL